MLCAGLPLETTILTFFFKVVLCQHALSLTHTRFKQLRDPSVTVVSTMYRSINIVEMCFIMLKRNTAHLLKCAVVQEGALFLSVQCNPRCLDVREKHHSDSPFLLWPHPDHEQVRSSGGHTITASNTYPLSDSFTFLLFHVSNIPLEVVVMVLTVAVSDNTSVLRSEETTLTTLYCHLVTCQSLMTPSVVK